MSWYKFEQKGDADAPTARECHSLAVFGQQLINFGGNDQSNRMNDVHILDTNTMKWTRHTGEVDLPAKRSAHSACLIDGRFLYVFGGWDGMTELGDLYRFDIPGKTWRRMTTEGPAPCPRHFHNAVALGRHMYVFGGYDGARWRNDTVCLNLDTLVWEEIKLEDDVKPGFRASGAAAIIHKDKVVVFGGYDGEDFLDDAWILHTTDALGARSHRWEKMVKPVEREGTPAPFWPAARSGHSVESCGHLLFFVGGRYRQGRFSDVVVLDSEKMTWSQMTVTGEPFRARKTHAIGRVGTKLYLFGGHDGEAWMGDMHVLDMSSYLRSCLPKLTVTVPKSTYAADMARLLGVFPPPRAMDPSITRDARKRYIFGVQEDEGSVPFDLRSTNPHNRVSKRSYTVPSSPRGRQAQSPYAWADVSMDDGDDEDIPADGGASAAFPLSSYAAFLGHGPSPFTPALASPLLALHITSADGRRNLMSGSPGRGGSARSGRMVDAGDGDADRDMGAAADPSPHRQSRVAGGALDDVSPAPMEVVSSAAAAPVASTSASTDTSAPVASMYVSNTMFADVTFVVEGEEIHLHRAILATRCEYFAGMFQAAFAEGARAIIPLPDIDLDVFRAIVGYIYFDALPDEQQLDVLVLPLLQQAQMMGLSRLSRQCQRYLEAAMAVDNTAAMLQSADTCGADMLRVACLRFILDHFPAVSTTYGFINLRADLMREVLSRRAQKEHGSVPAPPASTPDAPSSSGGGGTNPSSAARAAGTNAMRRLSRSLDHALHSAQMLPEALPAPAAHAGPAYSHALLAYSSAMLHHAAASAAHAEESAAAAQSTGKRRRSRVDMAVALPLNSRGGVDVHALVEEFERDGAPAPAPRARTRTSAADDAIDVDAAEGEDGVASTAARRSSSGGHRTVLDLAEDVPSVAVTEDSDGSDVHDTAPKRPRNAQ